MDEVVIVEYNPQWKILFEQESEQLSNFLDKDLIARIEHFGSTAVPGLAAKPIIDILVGVSSLASAKNAAILKLQELGYA